MNQNASCNGSATNSSLGTLLSCPTADHPGLPPSSGGSLLLEVIFGSSIYMIVVSFITVVANTLLLIVIYADPYKTFRNPTSCFIIGLAFADVVTGLVQEPIYASCFLLLYLGHPAATTRCIQPIQYTTILAFVTMNASFCIVLAFTATQLIVITSPLKYAPYVTRKKASIVVLMIYAYTITFGLLHLLKLPNASTLKKVDLFLHSLFMVYMSIGCYVLLYRAFRRKTEASKALRRDIILQGNQRGSDRGADRKFVAINFLLIFLIVITTQPIALFLLYEYYWAAPDAQRNFIPRLILDDVLYLKFMLDPFVYAWRLPKFRRALRAVLRCRTKTKDAGAAPLARQAVIRMAKSNETVVTLSFKKTSTEE